MAKFKKGDKCRVIKNFLSPECVGHIVTIKGVNMTAEDRVYYDVEIDGYNLTGIAAEGCLEPIKTK